MSKISCNNTLCDYCVRSHTGIKSYVCVLDDVRLEIDIDLDDDYVRCDSFEMRHHSKFERIEENE